jgi:predicted RNase H-like nuclease (RuvC/YqgF family)
MFKWFKKNKEKPMTEATNTTKTTRQLKKDLTSQKNEISKLRGRISELVDEVTDLRGEVAVFRERITSDMKLLFEKNKKR